MDTLSALGAAVIDNPAERSVRLVYADALDESGNPADAVRAVFIRAHVELESLPDGDPRRTALTDLCDELFAANWVEWWRPVCAAMGLPEPRVVKRRRRAKPAKTSRPRRPRPDGAPYSRAAGARGVYAIRSEQHGFTAQFIAGFPELLSFDLVPPATGIAPWAGAVPLARIRVAQLAEGESAGHFDDPRLAKVAELTVDRLSSEAASELALARHLGAVTSLKVLPLDPGAPLAVRSIVRKPAWAGLRSLTLSGVAPPDAIRALAEHCKLKSLESLSLGVREVPEPPTVVGFSGAIGAMISTMLAQAFAAFPLPRGPIRWADYWPALYALARSPVLPRLRKLQLTDADPHDTPLGNVFSLFDPPRAAGPDTQFPDALVKAVADGLNADKLERLELPAARLSAAGRADLRQRFGARFVPA